MADLPGMAQSLVGEHRPVIDLSGYSLSVLREGEPTLYRGYREGLDPILMVSPLGEPPAFETVKRLEREYALRAELDPCWAVQPLALERYRDRPALVLQDPGGSPLDRLLGRPLDVPRFLHLAIGLATALRQMHQRGFVHKDIKPANALVDAAGNVRLTGFGIASRLPRERQMPAPPEVIAGTYAYMAPEQTGRMNRSIDARSDLYSLGVTYYEMLTGTLPFAASDPMEWVHCHIARKPAPPSERTDGIPAPIEAIVLKLLAKIAEERYLTAAGLETDLRRCAAAWEAHGRIETFALGADDVSDRLLIPEKLYGREPEIGMLIAAFGRVEAGGAPELELVSGYSGIGKSSVINELHKVLVPSHGLFAAGKFDQYKRDIPYATLAQAFQSLVRQILGKGDEEVRQWRDALREAVGANGQLMSNLIPEVELVIGKQPPLPDLSPQDARNRFQTTFRRFLGVFARPEHPLALFLDDLQWLDSATLALIERLVTEPELRHLMLIGAYRDNEVSPSHPLMRALASIRKSGATVQEIVLQPLALDDVGRLVADALHTERDRANPLAELVYEKTGGNPLFAIQFITTLAEEGLVAFDPDPPAWQWNMERIRAKGYTDNLADLMAGKLNGLPGTTLEALKQFACLGNSAQSATLSMVIGVSEEQLHAALWPVVWAGLVFHLEDAYAFLHDRVQEAAYALIPAGERAAVHLRIGRVLASRTPPVDLEENIFEIVNQLNRGADLISSQSERERTAELNLAAGRRAKSSTAYASALMYFAAGGALLSRESWEGCYALTFALALQQAECEYLTGDLPAAESRLAMLSGRAGNLADSAAVTCLSVELYTNLDRADRALEIGLQYLRQVGVEWALHPTDDEVSEEYARIWRALGTRPIAELINLPPMTDPDCRATLDVLTSVHAPANFTDGNLLSLIIGRMANLSLEHGNGDGSCLAYVYLGMILESRFGDYRAGFRFGKLGVDLVEQGRLDRFKARVYLNFGNAINPWTRHVRTSLELLNCAFDTAQARGDLTFMAYSYANLVTAHLAAGDPLSEVQREAEIGLAFVEKARFGTAADLMLGQLGLIRALRGLTPDLSSFDSAELDERRFERHLEADPGLAMPACWYWIRKLQSRFCARDYGSAVAAAAKAEALLWTSPAFLISADYHFYGALARAAQFDSASGRERSDILIALQSHHRQLGVWAETCPETFANRKALVGAEMARLEGRQLDAERLFEEAVRSAHEHAFTQNEAIANERAGQFYAARGFEKIAGFYLRDARDCYLRWGADGKVKQLEQSTPHLRRDSAARPDGLIGTPVEQLDLATVVKVSQAVSGEIDLKSLIHTLMVTALEHAGAERGLLILPRGDQLWIEAKAVTVRDTVELDLRATPIAPAELPQSILRYVARTQEGLLLDDARDPNPFSGDEYIRRHRCRSVLCVPCIKQTRLVGVLYLENNQASHVFTPARFSLLKLLASQAAIALENARLYAELSKENSERRKAEAALRESEASLVEGQRISHTGSWRWNVRTGAVKWSAEYCRIFGFDPAVEQPSYAKCMLRIHPEDQSLVQRIHADAIRGKRIFQHEYRIVMPDGSTRYLQSTGHPDIDENGEIEFVGAVMDITERRHAEEALRRSQSELALVARLSTMGELAGSIIHEINQPLAAMLMSAEACLNWLNRDQPDLDEARSAISRLARDSKRAADVIKGLRALAQRSGVELRSVDINDAIREVLALLRGDLERGGVVLDVDLLADDRPVHGDRVQLQQVLLNLIRNGIEAMSAVADRTRILKISSKAAESGKALVSVEDTGAGIDKETADRMFEPLFTTKANGMGMGLSICRSIVEAHRGRLWATPNHPRGTVFQFTVPFATATDPSP